MQFCATGMSSAQALEPPAISRMQVLSSSKPLPSISEMSRDAMPPSSSRSEPTMYTRTICSKDVCSASSASATGSAASSSARMQASPMRPRRPPSGLHSAGDANLFCFMERSLSRSCGSDGAPGQGFSMPRTVCTKASVSLPSCCTTQHRSPSLQAA